jgi:farnesyl-diphosphate farnesyltransferase
LKNNTWQIYYYWLNQVSRSFAVCIPSLEKGLREKIALSYLLLRVLDSIEDSNLNLSQKHLLINQLIQTLKNKKLISKTCHLYKNIHWEGINDKERNLLTSGGLNFLFEEFWNMQVIDQDIIKECIIEMSKGMLLFIENKNDKFKQHKKLQVIKSLKEYNEYCYYVAGTVGILLEKFSSTFYDNNVENSMNNYDLVIGFSRALQKTNIIKDHIMDKKKGFTFLPSILLENENHNYPMCLQDVHLDLEKAMNYIIQLPKHYKGYRKFCLQAILPAYETLIWGNNNLAKIKNGNVAFKIKKTTFIKCLFQAKTFQHFPSLLRNKHTRFTNLINT